MLALQGYYDGNAVQTLEEIHAKKNQKLIITILDEFIDDIDEGTKSLSARGSLAQYANPELQKKEAFAWEEAVKTAVRSGILIKYTGCWHTSASGSWCPFYLKWMYVLCGFM